MKPWMKPSFDDYDDSEEERDCDVESDFEYPKLLVDVDGRMKFVLSKIQETELLTRIEMAKQ
jgi:hypothetical protein